jgi:hypothetical protein
MNLARAPTPSVPQCSIWLLTRFDRANAGVTNAGQCSSSGLCKYSVMRLLLQLLFSVRGTARMVAHPTGPLRFDNLIIFLGIA